MAWDTIAAPHDAAPPRPITARVQNIPARRAFPDHAHDWGQLAYAVTGVLTVAVEGRSFAISPEQAVWLPTGARHRVGSLLGAEFRSLWIADEAIGGLPAAPAVIAVTPLLRALIIEAGDIQDAPDPDGYRGRVAGLILDQLRRARPLAGALPWPRGGSALTALCEALYADPADSRGPDVWAKALGMSERTMARRFDAELGMSLRSWRRRLRLFKAVELLGGGLDVTRTALELGYGSASAFVHAFRLEMGCTPQTHRRGLIRQS